MHLPPVNVTMPFAVRERRGNPRVVPRFRCPFPPGMPPSLTPGSSVIERVQSLDTDTGLRRDLSGSALPTIPQSVSRGARFRGFLGSPSLRPARLLAPLYGSDRAGPATGGFYFRACDGSVTLTVAGYHYDSHWTPLSAGLSPAGMAASVAAPDPSCPRVPRIRLRQPGPLRRPRSRWHCGQP